MMKIVMTLMDKMFLSCKDATYYISVKKFKPMGSLRKLQLKIHLMMCKHCYQFNKQNELIDKGLINFSEQQTKIAQNELSSEKKSELKNTVQERLS